MAERLVKQTGVAVWSRDYRRSEKSLKLKNGGTILFRSLDDPDKVVRGPELSWVFLDEGRNLDMYAWKLVIGRLRQPGYKWGAWVSSTPNGHDWMWRVFHDDSPDRWADTLWFNAPTKENIHLPPAYQQALDAAYTGRFYEQEVLGKFVGAVEGGVFPYWDPKKYVAPLVFRPELPLYTFWDFGYGDTGVCVFAQVEWLEKEPDYPGQPGKRAKLPVLYILDAVDAKEWTAKDWAREYKTRLENDFGGHSAGNYGDPAGRSRQLTTGTSVISDLAAAGVDVAPVVKRPQDYAVRILNNMMAAGRVLIADSCNPRVSEALSHHHWKLDGDGTKVGNDPVHDWTSHFVDALRYGTTAVLSFLAREPDEEPAAEYGPDTYGYVFAQLLRPRVVERWGQRRRQKVEFIPRAAGPREG